MHSSGLIAEMPSQSKDVQITWIYEEDDVDMKEVGEDYQIMVGDIIQLQSKSILN